MSPAAVRGARVFLGVRAGRGSLLPIQPLQVLWINMIISIIMTVPIAFEPNPFDLMKHPPRSPQQPLLSRPLLQRIALISLLNLMFIFGISAWIRESSGDLPVQSQPVLGFPGGTAAGPQGSARQFLTHRLWNSCCFALASPTLLLALLANRWPVNWVPSRRTITAAG